MTNCGQNKKLVFVWYVLSDQWEMGEEWLPGWSDFLTFIQHLESNWFHRSYSSVLNGTDYLQMGISLQRGQHLVAYVEKPAVCPCGWEGSVRPLAGSRAVDIKSRETAPLLSSVPETTASFRAKTVYAC